MNSRDITFELNLNSSAEEVWHYFLEPKKLESWLTEKAHVEPKTGGAYELFWCPSTPNDNSTIGCKILTIVPYKLLSFEWRGPVLYAGFMSSKPFPTWVSMSFERVGIHQTIIHFRHTGWSASKEWVEARRWQENAWKAAFSQLKKIADSSF